MVARFLEKADDKYTMGEGITEQIESIRRFAEPMTGRAAQVCGSYGSEVPKFMAHAFMQSFPNNTTFAVYLSLPRGTEGWEEGLTHWQNAVRRDDSIEYIDFQTNHQTFDKMKAHSTDPNVGQAFHSENPALGVVGEQVMDPQMIVIAFPPGASMLAQHRDSSSSSGASAAAT